jgi:hypothetical protein
MTGTCLPLSTQCRPDIANGSDGFVQLSFRANLGLHLLKEQEQPQAPYEVDYSNLITHLLVEPFSHDPPVQYS